MIAELLASVSGAGLLATVGTTVYFAVKHGRAVEHAASVQVAQAHVEGEYARAEFEIETLRQQLDLAERRADALQEVLNADANPNSDLSGADLRTRLLRFAQATAARVARDSGDAVVPQDAATAPATVADVLAGIADVR